MFFWVILAIIISLLGLIVSVGAGIVLVIVAIGSLLLGLFFNPIFLFIFSFIILIGIIANIFES